MLGIQLISALLLAVTAAHAEPLANDVAGRYWLPDRDGQIEIALRDGRYFGTVVAYDEPDQLDELNPDPQLQARTILGLDLFESFRFDGEERWVGGTIYDARSGSTYDCEMWFEGSDRSLLWARGYVGIPLFGRTESFERVP